MIRYIIETYERYYNGYKQVYMETFAQPYPCHTVLGTRQLAHKDYLVDIDVDVPLRNADFNQLQPNGKEIRKIGDMEIS